MFPCSKLCAQVCSAHVCLPCEPPPVVRLCVVLLEHLTAALQLARQLALGVGLGGPRASGEHLGRGGRVGRRGRGVSMQGYVKQVLATAERGAAAKLHMGRWANMPQEGSAVATMCMQVAAQHKQSHSHGLEGQCYATDTAAWPQASGVTGGRTCTLRSMPSSVLFSATLALKSCNHGKAHWWTFAQPMANHYAGASSRYIPLLSAHQYITKHQHCNECSWAVKAHTCIVY